MVYIGSNLPDEFTESYYTKQLKGALEKANATQGLPALIEIASKKRFKGNTILAQNMDGIGIIQNLHFHSIMNTKNRNDLMYSKPSY